MKNLKNKLNKKGGFTLIEMLIVVAIIAILIAVSIPIIGTALEKARDATDDANFRSAAALGNITYLTDETITTETEYYYAISDDNVTGVLVAADDTTANKYESKCTSSTEEGATGTKTGQNIKVTINPNATDKAEVVLTEWVDK